MALSVAFLLECDAELNKLFSLFPLLGLQLEC